MLQISHVGKTFNKGTVNEKIALRDVSLHLEPGDFVTVIGGNGAGKSTLMNCISGFFYPDEGQIMLGGQDITFDKEYKRARSIGRLFQDPLKGTAPSMTIEENLALAFMRGKQRGVRFGLDKKVVSFFREKLAELGLGLEDRLKTQVGLLSGGQRQAITLLMATLNTPKLLLLDEHTAALDPATADKVLELTRKIVAQNHITTIMITHNIKSALNLGSRTVMMNGGSIVLELSGEERRGMTTARLLELFHEKSREDLDNDRILLSE